MFGKVDEDEIHRVTEDIKNIVDPSKMERVTSHFLKTHSYHHNTNFGVVYVTDNNDSENRWGMSTCTNYHNFGFGTNFFLTLSENFNSFFEIDIIYMSYVPINPILTCVLYPKGGSVPICDMVYKFDGSKQWTATPSEKFKKWLKNRDLTMENMNGDDWVVCFFDFKDMRKRYEN